LDNLGAAYARLGQPTKTLEYDRQALPLLEAAGDRYKQALVLGNIGHAQYDLGNTDDALNYYNRALALFEASGDPLEQAKSLKNIATVQRDRGQLSEARAEIEQAIERSEFIRNHAGSEERRSSYVAMMSDHYDFYVDLLMRMHDDDRTA